jgi:hypothetical protein
VLLRVSLLLPQLFTALSRAVAAAWPYAVLTK